MKREPIIGAAHEVADTIARWAAQNRRIRRVWVVGRAAKGTPRAGEGVDVAIEVEPVGDSEETLAVWMANEGAWRAQLRRSLSRSVGLEWVDTDGTRTDQSTRDEAKLLVYDRTGR